MNKKKVVAIVVAIAAAVILLANGCWKKSDETKGEKTWYMEDYR